MKAALLLLLIVVIASSTSAEDVQSDPDPPSTVSLLAQIDVDRPVMFTNNVDAKREIHIRLTTPKRLAGFLPRITTRVLDKDEAENVLNVIVRHASGQSAYSDSETHTIWYPEDEDGEKAPFQLDVLIGTYVKRNVTFRFEAALVNVELPPFESKSAVVAPNAPFVWRFDYDNGANDVDHFRVDFSADDDANCALVAVQPLAQRFDDSEANVKFRDYRLTMLGKANMDVPFKEDFLKGFFVIALTEEDDSDCDPRTKDEIGKIVDPNKNITASDRLKNITVIVRPMNLKSEFVVGVVATTAFYVIGSVLAFFIVACCNVPLPGKFVTRAKEVARSASQRIRRRVKRPDDEENAEEVDGVAMSSLRSDVAIVSETDHVDGIVTEIRSVAVSAVKATLYKDEHQLRERVITQVYKEFLTQRRNDTHERLLQGSLKLSHLARNCDKALFSTSLRSSLYFWIIWIMGAFYTIPVIQIALRDQQHFIVGDFDRCYYNFGCMTRAAGIVDFGHVFSNISYVLSGVCFGLMCWVRQRRHRNYIDSAENDAERQRRIQRGVPEFYGIYSAMSAALVMEGILSGCYHICPNNVSIYFTVGFTMSFFLSLLRSMLLLPSSTVAFFT